MCFALVVQAWGGVGVRPSHPKNTLGCWHLAKGSTWGLGCVQHNTNTHTHTHTHTHTQRALYVMLFLRVGGYPSCWLVPSSPPLNLLQQTLPSFAAQPVNTRRTHTSDMTTFLMSTLARIACLADSRWDSRWAMLCWLSRSWNSPHLTATYVYPLNPLSCCLLSLLAHTHTHTHTHTRVALGSVLCSAQHTPVTRWQWSAEARALCCLTLHSNTSIKMVARRIARASSAFISFIRHNEPPPPPPLPPPRHHHRSDPAASSRRISPHQHLKLDSIHSPASSRPAGFDSRLDTNNTGSWIIALTTNASISLAAIVTSGRVQGGFLQPELLSTSHTPLNMATRRQHPLGARGRYCNISTQTPHCVCVCVFLFVFFWTRCKIWLTH